MAQTIPLGYVPSHLYQGGSKPYPLHPSLSIGIRLSNNLAPQRATEDVVVEIAVDVVILLTAEGVTTALVALNFPL
jgi:hypothetical protein